VRVRRSEHPIALDAGDPGTGRKIPRLQLAAVVVDPVYVILVTEHVGRDGYGIERVCSDVVSQGDVSVSELGRLHDQLVSLEQIFGGLGLVVVAADEFPRPGVLHHGQVAIPRILGHDVIYGHQVHGHAEVGVSGHVEHVYLIVDQPVVDEPEHPGRGKGRF